MEYYIDPISFVTQKSGFESRYIKNLLGLLDEGATIPFISRYRKEMTGSMDEVQVGQVREIYEQFKELEKRKKTVLESIEQQEKLTPELRRQIEHCTDLRELEDIYLPYKPKKQTRASKAKAKGLEPLAAMLMKQDNGDVWDKAARFVKNDVENEEEALQGARDIIAEWVSENDRARNTVRRSFDREYTGCLVNFKTEKPSYKVKHSVENPIEKQAIFPNHHEPIIDTETWERVQELRKQRKRPNRYDEVGLFSGMLFCADCGHVLYQQRYQNKNRKQDCYICGSYKKRTRDCTAHFIRTDLLTAGVLSNLRQVTEYAARHESRFVKLLIQQNEIGGKRKTAAATKQLEQAQTRIAEVNRIIKRLYEDNVSGKISDERFMELSADYEQEQRELKDRAAALQEELSKSQAATVNAEKFMGIVRKHLAFEELTPTLLREMIEKIVVHECSYDENGTRRQDIEIYYSFVGKIDLPEA